MTFSETDDILNGDRVFFLSAEEAKNAAYGFINDNSRVANYGNSAGDWWLRSPHASNGSASGYVFRNGEVSTLYVSGGSSRAARPAFNLNTSSVLFTSAAKGGKSSSAISEIPSMTSTEWKLTLLDSSRPFTVTDQTPITAMAGNTIELDYTGAVTGENEYISVIITRGTDALYYGRILKTVSENGTVHVTLPKNLPAGSYTLKVFNEQYNDDYQTDYASAFCDVALTILAPSVPETGDSANLVALWIGLCGLSLLALVCLWRRDIADIRRIK